MQTRVAASTGANARVPPACLSLQRARVAQRPSRNCCRQGAEQLLCLPAGAAPPEHVVIFVQDAAAQDPTLAVAASLLRHIPAEAVFLGIHDEQAPEQSRGTALRDLLDLRNSALVRHGLDTRTELRSGDAGTELLARAGESRALDAGPRHESLDAHWPAASAKSSSKPGAATPACSYARRRPAGGGIVEMSAGSQAECAAGFRPDVRVHDVLPQRTVLLRSLRWCSRPRRLTWQEFTGILLDERALASYRLSSARHWIAAADQRGVRVHRGVVAGALRLPGRRSWMPVIDLPFALPTAVSRHRTPPPCSRDPAGLARSSPSRACRSPTPGSASWSHHPDRTAVRRAVGATALV